MEIKEIAKPKNELGKLDKEKVCEMYMASPHISWVKFAESLGWNPHRSRTDFPVALWTEEKKKIIAKQTSEEIKDAVLELKGNYHTDIIKTLKEYPKAADNLYGIINAKIQSLLVEDSPKVSTREVIGLAKALETVTKTKHKSLMLDLIPWTPEHAQNDATKLNEPNKNQEDTEWKIEVIGCENLSSTELATMLAQYYNKPQKSKGS